MDEQKRALGHLQDLLDIEEGLTDSELKWVEILAKIDDRPFSEREREIIYNIYDRRC